ncbi:hypothetical protein CRM22_008641 [Opisthorchis felineus]|uniref:C2H2-type domain-containing protein n=1 Tax=Opisthorchis felineus TaxID=147828 RepID=A0A4S2LC89_OPIFE|nr:hypothetical protein CRM22_008641 [Opisthorchis felineus]
MCIVKFVTAQNHLVELNGLFAEYVPVSNEERPSARPETGNGERLVFARTESGNIHSSLPLESRQQLENTSPRVTTWDNSKPEARNKESSRCPVCKKSFRFRSAVLPHQEIHSKSPDLFCRLCTETFRGPRKLWYHCRKYHAGETDLPSRTSKEQIRESEEYGNPCPECDKCFATWRYLRRHRKSVHQARERYLCEQCAETFTTKANAMRHRKTVHAKESHPRCAFCEKTFSRFDVLQRHIKSTHN